MSQLFKKKTGNFDKDYLRVKCGTSFSLVKPSVCVGKFNPEIPNMKMVPSLAWGVRNISQGHNPSSSEIVFIVSF